MNEDALQEALANPQNLGEMADADAVGTVGSPDCGDMVRMWLKYKTVDGRKVIDKASFQSFGCQTALAVASLATQMLRGKTVDEAKHLNASELSAPLGPLPPMKIHCGQMVEGALKAALEQETDSTPALSSSETIASSPGRGAKTLHQSMMGGASSKPFKVVKLSPPTS